MKMPLESLKPLSIAICMFAPIAAFAQDEVFELSPFVVEAGSQRGYLAQTAVSGTALNTALKDIPISLRVVTEDFMNDTFAIDLAAAVAFVPGVTSTGETREEGSFNIRGFRVNRAKRDGLTALYAQDMTNVSRVEVVKGPNSILYGETSPGGIINYVTKRPMTQSFQRLDLSVGSYGFFRSQLETTGPIWKGESGAMLLYRLDASYQQQDGWRDFEDGDRTFIAPMIEWRPFPTTTVSVQYEWISRDERQRASHHLYSTKARAEWLAADDAFKAATAFSFFNFRDQPYDAIADYFGYRFTSASRENYNRYEGRTIVGQFTQSLWDRRINIRASVTHTRPELDILTQQMNLLLFRSGEGQNVFTARTLFNNKETSYQLQISARWEIANIENRTLMGAEYEESEFRGQIFPALTPPFHLFVPNLATFPPEFLPNQPITQNEQTPISATPGTIDSRDRMNRAFYMSNLTTLFDGKIRLLLGGRFDVQQQYVVHNNTRSPRDREFIPQAGLIYSPIEPISIYASYSKSFVPMRELGSRFNPTDPRNPFRFSLDPLIGTGRELGIKMDLLDNRVSGAIALFEITYDNFVRGERISYFDDRGIERFFVETRQDVQAVSKGIEFDFTLTPLPNWQIVTGYAYIETDNGLGGEDSFEDAKGVAKNQFSLWNKYTFAEGRLENFSIGIGAIFQDKVRMVDPDPVRIDDSLRAPAYWRFDLMLGYTFTTRDIDWNVQLNVRNALDKEFYLPNVVPGDPRQIFFSLGLSF